MRERLGAQLSRDRSPAPNVLLTLFPFLSSRFQVQCLAVSKSGRYLASGQITYMGFTADIIVWDLNERKMIHRLSLHKVKVQALSFSCDEKYLASLGGADDNSLVIWDVEADEPICGSPTHSDHTLTVKFFNTTPFKLITGGKNNLNVWDFDLRNLKIRESGVQLGQYQRIIQCISMDDFDEFAYCGTSSGDLLQCSLPQKLFKNSGPAKHMVSQGIRTCALTPTGDIMIGGGDGSLSLLKKPELLEDKRPSKLKVVASCNINGSVSSLAFAGVGDGYYTFLAGTGMCEMYVITYYLHDGQLTQELIQSCHPYKINDVVFPADYSTVFATCSMNDIRVWHRDQCRELLRIKVPNVECNCVSFSADGKSIISGWSDGKIRAFGPQTGKLLYTIPDAHPQGVTAITGTSNSTCVISGGGEGMVRVWRIGAVSQSMVASMKEHKSAVNCIAMRSNDEECASASSDGSCIIWDLKRFKRNTAMFASTFFKAICYDQHESQLVTTGTDRKITYWDAYDGQAIRVIDGSLTDAMNTLDISPEGNVLVSGGSDKLVKIWGYDEGLCYYDGRGHSGAVTKVKIAPDKSNIISVGSEGAIFIWDYKDPPIFEDNDS